MGIKKIKILIVDDHKMLRDGIRTMLQSQAKRYKFMITEAGSGEEAIDKVTLNDYDIVLIDYQLPNLNGADTVKNMVAIKSSIKVLALSNYDEYTYITNIMNEGAKGYVLKNIGPDELIHAIETILSGKNYYADDVAIKLIDIETSSKKMSARLDKHGITKRELQVLKMIANEMTNEEIAKKLVLGKRTIDSHRQNLMNKLNVRNTAGLVKYAYEFKLVS